MKLIGNLDVAGKRVLLRADLDIDVEQLAKGGQTEYPTRLKNIKPSVDFLLSHGASAVVILGHIYRPKGPDPKLSTKQLVGPISEILGQTAVFVPDFEVAKGQQNEKVQLFENLRFWPGETENSEEFARQLASLGDVYINDAFANCHRAHASMVALAHLLPSAAGLNLEKEVNEMRKVLGNPQRPFIAVIGGAKLETKLPVIANLARTADKVLVGGLMSVQYDPSAIDEQYRERVIAAVLTRDTEDIDESSIAKFESVLEGAKMVVWNGPVSHFEGGFVTGTKAIAEAIIASGAESIIGGGQTEEFLAEYNLLQKFSFISSGGGAMLEFLAGRTLPGIEALA
ncbi:phosphoglycerate kinase [Candidatus Curtissbacteria bacterium]|nr:phosphoglycerate kinase [Candidatus Curtissbacteria bacterium]